MESHHTGSTAIAELIAISNSEIAAHSQKFFKTDAGQYGAGDIFLGIRVPQIRQHAKRYKNLPTKETLILLASKYHEVRLCAVFILVNKFKTTKSESEKHTIYTIYLSNTQFINNWDIIDGSAMHIVGAFLSNRSREVLQKLANSNNLWERRISIMATFHFIKSHDFDDTLKLAELLLNDSHDLIHKAVGWMLREVGNRNREVETTFLDRYYPRMPRTMLRYAIEKFPDDLRLSYLKGSRSTTLVNSL